MKNNFRGYYLYTDEEFKNLWKDAIFIFDTSTLLDLYGCSKKTFERFIEILNKVSDRIWIPHQIFLEYHRNRLERISQEKSSYDKRKKDLEDMKSKLKLKRHPLIDIKKFSDEIDDAFKQIEKILDEFKSKHPDLKYDDNIRDNIVKLFDKRVGSPYSLEELEKIYKTGNLRYDQKIPPGYIDIKKRREENYVKYGEFGDLILWLQIIDHAKDVKKPVIFICDDQKEDWYLISKGEKKGPRYELINEFYSKTGQDFYMYTSEIFMKRAETYLNEKVDQDVITEFREINLYNILTKKIDKDERDILYQGPISSIEEIRDDYDKILNEVIDELLEKAKTTDIENIIIWRNKVGNLNVQYDEIP